MQHSHRLLTAASVVLLTAIGSAKAVVLGQVDTFQNSTTNNWGGGFGSLANVSSGGPAGVGDAYFQVTSTGGGAGGKMTTFNRNQWTGNYAAAGVKTISMDLENQGTGPLSIRLAFKDGTGSGAAGYSSTTAFALPADSAWHHATFSIASAAFTDVNFPSETFDALLTGPAELRILSATSPSLGGDNLVAVLGIDNIAAGGVVPEPASISMLLVGSCLMLGKRRSK